MNDMTTGAFVSYVIALTAEAVLRSGVGEVVKDYYAELKSKLSMEWKDQVKSIEDRPDSKHRQAALAELIDECEKGDFSELVSCAENLRVLVIRDHSESSVGAKLNNVSAKNIKFGVVEIESGVGLIIEDATVSENIDVSTLRVGKFEGKPPR